MIPPMKYLLIALPLALVGCADPGECSLSEADATADLGEDVADSTDTPGEPDTDVSPDSDAGPARLCNGSASICNTPFDRVALPGTHNSMSAREQDFFAPNHEFGIERQLQDGIRAMLIDTYFWREDFYFCHGACEIGATLASEGLGWIRSFLDENPDEVLAIIFQNAISPEETVQILDNADLTRFVMTPRDSEWPTVAELIDQNERLLVTLESGAGPPWLPHAWDVFFDTPYSFSSADQFTCDTNRGSSENSLHLLNHWLADPLPTPPLGELANSYQQLSARVAECQSVGVFPNVVAVDFYDTGALFEVVAELNEEASE